MTYCLGLGRGRFFDTEGKIKEACRAPRLGQMNPSFNPSYELELLASLSLQKWRDCLKIEKIIKMSRPTERASEPSKAPRARPRRERKGRVGWSGSHITAPESGERGRGGTTCQVSYLGHQLFFLPPDRVPLRNLKSRTIGTSPKAQGCGNDMIVENGKNLSEFRIGPTIGIRSLPPSLFFIRKVKARAACLSDRQDLSRSLLIKIKVSILSCKSSFR